MSIFSIACSYAPQPHNNSPSSHQRRRRSVQEEDPGVNGVGEFCCWKITKNIKLTSTPIYKELAHTSVSAAKASFNNFMKFEDSVGDLVVAQSKRRILELKA